MARKSGRYCLHVWQVKGLPEALADSNSNVVSNYSAATVEKTFEKMKKVRAGECLFTFPPMPIKCPGAPQKIMYLADDYWRQVREGAGLIKVLGFDRSVGGAGFVAKVVSIWILALQSEVK